VDNHESPRQPAWRRYLRLIRPNPVADLDDELRDHIESATESLVARGLSPADARAEAIRRFGDVTRVRSEVQRLDARHTTHSNRLVMLETFLYDLRHAARGLRRSPAFTIVATLSIALGVAANTTVFSAINAVLFRPIPGTHADRLVRMYVNHHSPFDWRDLSWFRQRATSFDYIIGERYAAMSFRASPSAESERIHASYVTRGYFPALGVTMALGRAFDVDEPSNDGTQSVAVLTHSFWQRRFAGDSAVIGRTILVSDKPLTVVGVAGPDFRSSVILWAPDVLIPFAVAPILSGQRLEEFGGSFYATARLKRGVDERTATNELRVLMTQLASSDSVRHDGMTVRLDHVRGVNAELRVGVAAGSAFLMVMVAMVLLIACANVANLLLGRATTRRTEIGVRLAIGASRGRLIRQLLTESILLSALGSMLGFVAAVGLTRVLSSLVPAEAGLGEGFFTPDQRVLLFTAILCVVTALLFGMVPALHSASPNLVSLLKGDDGTTRRRRRRGALVAVQSALCVLLLAVALLFARSLASMRGIDPGFRADGVVDATIDLGLLGSTVDKHRVFERLLERASTLPGVEDATLTAVIPLSGSNMETRIAPDGATYAHRRDEPSVYFHVIAPKYFETMKIPLQRGREFAASDVDGSAPVAIISATAARTLWPAGAALGKRFRWGGPNGRDVQVIGIANDAAYVNPGETPKAVVYMPFAQEQRSEMTLQLRTSSGVGTVRRAVWDMLREEVPALPPPPVARMADDMAITLLPVKLGAGLLGAFGIVALTLAAAGIYGVAAYSVARRTREIGVRAALGATRTQLISMVLWESGRRVGVGAAIGVLLTIGLATALSRILYGVHPLDAVVLVGVVAMIAVIALLATLGPARRAARADPVTAIRSE
jgi:predicted permease